MTVPARSPVDDALDRLRQQINKSRATYVPGTPEKYPATELRGLTVLEAEALLAQAEQLREERDEYAERLAWHREERDAYLKGNVWVTRAAEEQARAEAAEADSRLAREQRDKLEEINERLAVELREALQYPSDMRDNAAEAEVRRLTEGLREWIADVDDALDDGPDAHDAAVRIGARWEKYDSRLRALLSASPTDGANTEGGEACQHVSVSFDRTVCACGSMHDYCDDCGRAMYCPLEAVPPAGGGAK